MKKKTHNHKIRSYKRKLRNQEQRYEFLKNYCKKVINDRDIAISKYESLLRKIRTFKSTLAVNEMEFFMARDAVALEQLESHVWRSAIHKFTESEEFIRLLKFDKRDEPELRRCIYECSLNVLAEE